MSTTKVLVIDDNEAHAEGLAELLEISGYDAFYATSGQQGIDLALSHRVDAVLLDINLPDMSGYEVCRRLRMEQKITDLAIVFHTAAMPTDVHHQADAFLTYPIEVSHICHVIQGCIARRKMGKASAVSHQ